LLVIGFAKDPAKVYNGRRSLEEIICEEEFHEKEPALADPRVGLTKPRGKKGFAPCMMVCRGHVCE
jgi:hypothetical protein